MLEEAGRGAARRAGQRVRRETGQPPPVGAVTVPAWQEGAEVSVLPRAYQELWKSRPTRGPAGGRVRRRGGLSG